MNILRDELINLPLKWDQDYVVLAPVFNYEARKLVALRVKGSSFLSRQRLLPLKDIIYSDSKLEVKDSKSVTQLQPQDAYGDKNKCGDLINKDVFAGERPIGKVITYKVSLETKELKTIWVRTPLHLRGIWRHTLLIDATQLISISESSVHVDELIAKTAFKNPDPSQIVRESEAILSDNGN